MTDSLPAVLAPRIIAPGDYDRRKYVGSSNIAAILGATPMINGRRYTAIDVWESKVSETPTEMDKEEKLFLDRRKRWEPVVVAMLKEEFDAEIVSVNIQYIDPEVDFFATEIDFEWRSPEDGLIRNGEIKTISPRAFGAKFGWGTPGTNEIPHHYEWQVQHAFGVTRRPGPTVVAAMVGLDDMLFYPIARDESAIEFSRAAATAFWNENVLANLPPAPRTTSDLAKLYPKTTSDLAVEADAEIAIKALRYRALDAQLDAITTEQDLLEFEMKIAMRDAEFLTIEGRRVVKWKDKKWSQLDQAGLKSAHPKVHREFIKSGVRREFTAYKEMK